MDLVFHGVLQQSVDEVCDWVAPGAAAVQTNYKAALRSAPARANSASWAW